jgi:TolB-like protein/class 3 adenylate cyclase/Tfp pilus assembly protein PilF
MTPESENNLRLEIGHVLFIDIVGYSKLLIEEQKERLRQLTDIVLATAQVRKATNERLVKLPTGDGMALVFRNSAEEPAQCALEITQALKTHPDIAVRMGIHSGPVSEVTDVSGHTNIAGGGINMAQRVMDCGDAGHILLSKHVADDLKEHRQWSSWLHDLGECEVKHGMRVSIVNLHGDEVGNPQLPKKFQALKKHRTRMRWATATAALLALAAIIAGIAMFSRNRGRSTLAAPDKSIAVLSFENRSEDKANAYFADGIQDEILTRLSKIADLKVISRTSTQHYKSAPENLPEIAKQLGVAHILEGSVQKSGDAVRVNVQLIKAANDSHLWADTFDRKLTDIFSVESEVAKAIAEQLRAKLIGREEQELAVKPTENPEAYDAYLRGLAYTLKAGNTAANALAAQKYLREAVRLDPKFALGWAQLSRVNARLAQTNAQREEARAAVETALRLQPTLGEALLAKGYYYYVCLKDYAAAVRYYEQAGEVLPNNSQIPESLAFVERRRGDWDSSENHFNQAERLDPRNAYLLTQHALSYMHLRRFREALRKLDQVLDIIPDDPDTLAQKAAIAQAEDDLPRAAALLEQLRPGAADSDALETQIYQAILERRTPSIIVRLKEIVAKPDPTLGPLNGELRFWLGWAEEVAGDQASAQTILRQAQTELQPFLKEQPDNYSLIGDLAMIAAMLDDKTTAAVLTGQAMTMISSEKDALDGPSPTEILARVSARAGDQDRAIVALEKLLPLPYNGVLASGVPLTPALLRLDPMFDPLRNDPRFQKLAGSPAPK